MIVVVDYGMGNLHSVCNALDKVKATNMISSNHEDIRNASGLILPGVGSFGDCIKNLKKYNLIEIITEQAKLGKPLLGICLGMQVLFERGYEDNINEGLGLLQGEVIRMQDTNVKIPHIGWNKLHKQQENLMFKDIKENPFVYYVHSYMVAGYKEENLIGYSSYGTMKIPGYVQKENILGMQFHPEKSGEEGLNMLKAFKEMCK